MTVVEAEEGQPESPSGEQADAAEPAHHPHSHARTGIWVLTLGALGVVYGDIGTSPLYAVRESLAAGGRPVTEARVLGVGSLAVWALILVITVKYLMLVMRADNKGEGGILALTAMVLPRLRTSARIGPTLLIAGCSARRCSTATGCSPRPSRC